MFKPRHLKDSVHFRKRVEKFVHFKRHLIEEEKLAAIRTGLDELRLLEATRPDKTTLKAAQDKLEELCRGSVPTSHAKPVGWLPENIDVFFTAIVVALGIRAYFLQPFKIPTGSMQPTLNGVVSESFPEEKPFPSVPVRAWEWLFNSRGYNDIRAESDDAVAKVTEKNLLVFFTRATIHLRSGKTHSVSATKAAVMAGAGWPQKEGGELAYNIPVRAGEIIFRGSSQGGDHLLVDKMSYHFRKPKRGEVFVFGTKGIKGIESGGSFRQEFGSQNYIKRLCAVPGDTLEITADKQLLINGERARGFGFDRVMSMKDGYQGYLMPPYPSLVVRFDLRPGKYETTLGRFWRNDIRIPQPVYWAMGDNQGSSSDSRFWGPVPQVNLVGPALIVYWPFGNHFGLIR